MDSENETSKFDIKVNLYEIFNIIEDHKETLNNNFYLNMCNKLKSTWENIKNIHQNDTHHYENEYLVTDVNYIIQQTIQAKISETDEIIQSIQTEILSLHTQNLVTDTEKLEILYSINNRHNFSINFNKLKHKTIEEKVKLIEKEFKKVGKEFGPSTVKVIKDTYQSEYNHLHHYKMMEKLVSLNGSLNHNQNRKYTLEQKIRFYT